MSASISKSLLAFLAASLVAAPARAIFGMGDIVFNPQDWTFQVEHESREMAHWAEQIKRYQDMIQKQVDMIENMTHLENSITSRIGDWKGVYDRALLLKTTVDDLRRNVGDNLSNFIAVDYGDGPKALLYTNGGLYGPLNEKTPFGTKIKISDDDLSIYNSVFKMNEKFKTEADATEKEIDKVLKEIATTSEQILASKNQEHLAKLTETKAMLELRLQQLQRKLEVKLQVMQSQIAAHEARRALEAEVRRTRAALTFKEARGADRYPTETK